MREAAAVIGELAQVIYWHLPANRTAVAIPDSTDFWHDILWPRRAEIVGIAHTHPGRGRPGPSLEDLTTFAATEAAFGRRLRWWIASADQFVELRWCGPDELDYELMERNFGPSWLEELRRHSGIENEVFEQEEDHDDREHPVGPYTGT